MEDHECAWSDLLDSQYSGVEDEAGSRAMGEEIPTTRFLPQDFERFSRRLQQETQLLRQWFREGRFVEHDPVGGFELEAWLIDREQRPAPINDRLLERLDTSLVVPELAKFNFEVNSTPQRLQGDALRRMQAELESTWAACRAAAAELDADALMIGILPTVREDELGLVNMSSLRRYRAINDRVLQMRQGSPLRVNIAGDERLRVTHYDVMLEAATTSFQIHLQVPQSKAARYFNAALIVSAPMVAAAANSPFLFGKDLWDETRIPLFEQSVELDGVAAPAQMPRQRVTFGSGYVRESLEEFFVENCAAYPVLLPIELNDDSSRLSHLRLHNGTIWRWNRPLIGFDAEGRPHLRIEHRVVPSGPSAVDEIANAAFYFGLSEFLATRTVPPEQELTFAQARDNFYAAARHGLHATVVWLDGRAVSVRNLILEELLPMARRGLEALKVAGEDVQRYLDVIEDRVTCGCNGATWQRAYVENNGRDMRALTAAYAACQRRGNPVHEWGVRPC